MSPTKGLEVNPLSNFQEQHRLIQQLLVKKLQRISTLVRSGHHIDLLHGSKSSPSSILWKHIFATLRCSMFAAPDQFDAAPSETGDSDNDIYYAENSVLNCGPAVEVVVCDTRQPCTGRHRKKKSLFNLRLSLSNFGLIQWPLDNFVERTL
jgi:hypothetical protein